MQACFREPHTEAVYVHCYAHELNLVLCYTCKAVPVASRFFELLENIYTCFSSSVVNHNKFIQVQHQLGIGISELVQLSPTRWACQLRSVRSVLKNLPAILTCLSTIGTPIAVGIQAKLRMPKTLYMLLMFSQLLGMTECLHRCLQGDSVDSGQAAEYKMAVLQSLRELLTAASAEDIFQTTLTLCEDNDIHQPLARRQKQKRLDDFVVESACGHDSVNVTSSGDFRQHLFYVPGQDARGALLSLSQCGRGDHVGYPSLQPSL